MSIHDHRRFLNRLKNQEVPLRIFYDVGANTGSWSCEAQTIYPTARYELFEPLAGLYPDLDQQARFAEINDHDLHSVALSDINGQAEIKILGNKGVGSSILILKSDYRKTNPLISIEQVKMDDYVRQKRIALPDFIKLDTQASEMKILKGAVECIKNAKFVLLETWVRRVYGPETPLFHEIAEFLYQNNYCLYEILSLKEGRDPDETLRWFDAVFINRNFSKFPLGML
jgi:FkbM family methyltransferase